MQKKTEIESRLNEARATLASAEEAKLPLAAREGAAIASSLSDYAGWKAERDANETELERLSKLIANLEAEFAAATEAESDSNIRKRYDAQQKANAILAKRIRADLTKANDVLLALIRDVSVAAVEDAKINGCLPDDLVPLVSAEQLARGKVAMPRKDLGTENILLWVKNDNGHLLGDQDSVEDQGEGRGVLRTGAGWHVCRQQLYRSVSFNPAERAEIPQSLFKAVRLPFPDRPGFAWDGDRLRSARDCLAKLSARNDATTERPIETELVFLPHAAPIAAAT
ncbi:hypothetical protein [Afipia broomeae]|uniref:Uncharacterized protein n=1 Tax=Afipia broomeae ATCC 49717 TaxID=883078 RepID=K8P7I8_9BRAD|nr:hypothetical protein [Afipia broomeae]EKS34343.1 hypothetical protein HMPREF9695_04253 [Afipia broomeae ATCC 49717]